MTQTITAGELRKGLANFYGSEKIYRHPLFKRRYSEGVQYLCENAGAYWLMEAIFSHQLTPKVANQEFQVWKLKVKDNTATLACTDGDDGKVTSQIIEYTDFPLPEIELFYTNETLYLPSEH